MCLLALINIDSVFTDIELMDFIEHNQDGLGFTRPDTHLLSVHTYKQPTTKGFVAKFREWHAATRADGQTTFAMHTRMKTHGAIDFHNAHPHYVTEEMQMMHNGILNIDCKSNPKNSDTIHYIEQVLRPLVALTQESAWVLTSPVLDLIGQSIGASNKLVFCTPAGFGVVNRQAGIEFRGSWFSNTYAWSLFYEGRPRGRREAKYDWKNSRVGPAPDWRDEWMDGFGYEGRLVSPVLPATEAEIDDFVAEIDYMRRQYYICATPPEPVPHAWQEKGAYSQGAVEKLALSLSAEGGADALTDYLDELYGEMSDEDEYAVGEM